MSSDARNRPLLKSFRTATFFFSFLLLALPLRLRAQQSNDFDAIAGAEFSF